MQDARWDIPAGSDIETISSRQTCDCIISSLGGILKCLEDLFLGYTGIETEECIREVAAVIPP
jgi:hypothetical protein